MPIICIWLSYSQRNYLFMFFTVLLVVVDWQVGYFYMAM